MAEVGKCPNCGEPYQDTNISKCPKCGYVFFQPPTDDPNNAPTKDEHRIIGTEQ